MNKNYNLHNNQKGVALVELALVLPMLFLLFYAFFAAIRLFATYNALSNIARIGTLWASAKFDEGQKCNGSCTKTPCRNDILSCENIAKEKMQEVAAKYERKLQLCPITYTVSANTSSGCIITVEVSATYRDSFFGSKGCTPNQKQDDINFGMSSTFSPFSPKLKFIAKAYRGKTC